MRNDVFKMIFLVVNATKIENTKKLSAEKSKNIRLFLILLRLISMY